MKTIDANQIQKIDRPYISPVYLVHIFLAGETLYFSDRNFVYNSHNYEAYVTDLPALAHSVERLGGTPNAQATVGFINRRFRSYNSLLEFFDDNPITRREMELFVLYRDTGETLGSDVSTKIAKMGIGEFRNIARDKFDADLMSITHLLDSKNPFIQINGTNWPNAAPEAVGKYENMIYGSLRNIPCHCVQTYAVSTLFLDMAASGETYITLSDVDYPITFPSSGCVQIGNEQIDFSAKDTTNKRLTVQTRGVNGTTASVHKRGTPVWLIETPVGTTLTFKYLAAGHQMKSLNVVYAGQDKIRIAAADYTVNLNDGGKSTITFTQRQLQKVLEIIASTSMNEGSHSHSSPSKIAVIGNGDWLSIDAAYTQGGSAADMRDQNNSTSKWVSIGSAQNEKGAILQVNFPSWSGPTITKIYACLTYACTLAGNATAKFYDNRGGGNNLIANLASTAGVQYTSKYLLATTQYPSGLWVSTNTGTPGGALSCYVYEIWMEIEYDNTGASAASGVSATVTVSGQDPEIIAPPIYCDGEGYQDDGSGTYTGSANALIENPSDVRRHIIVALLGRLMAEIGASFGTIRTTYANRITGGYKFGFILSRLGEKPSEVFKSLDQQSRSSMREDGGKFELIFNDTAEPTSILTLDKDSSISDVLFGQTSQEEIRNTVRASYDLDWSGQRQGKRFGDYLKQVERSNATSITKYGTLYEDVSFPAIYNPEMAQDVADWILLQRKDVLKTVQLVADWSARKLERDDFFTLTWDFWSGLKWRVLHIEEIPKGQEFLIQAVQFISV